jgi:hypothetical protein
MFIFYAIIRPAARAVVFSFAGFAHAEDAGEFIFGIVDAFASIADFAGFHAAPLFPAGTNTGTLSIARRASSSLSS